MINVLYGSTINKAVYILTFPLIMVNGKRLGFQNILKNQWDAERCKGGKWVVEGWEGGRWIEHHIIIWNLYKWIWFGRCAFCRGWQHFTQSGKSRHITGEIQTFMSFLRGWCAWHDVHFPMRFVDYIVTSTGATYFRLVVGLYAFIFYSQYMYGVSVLW